MLSNMENVAWFFKDVRIGDAFNTRDGAKVIFQKRENGLFDFKGGRHRYFAVREDGYYNHTIRDNNDILGKFLI